MSYIPLINTIGLSQIANFKVPTSFTDSNNMKWELVKDAFSSATSVPDPKQTVFTDFWCHKFPSDLKQNIYLYVVEGVKTPQVNTEMPVGILYAWFSLNEVRNFTPMMITDVEWLRANVYSSRITDARVSKLNAICGVSEQKMDTSDSLIHLDE